MPGTGTNDQHVATPGLNEHNGKWTGNDRRRAWQGIVYLPENKNENENARTTLHLAGLVDSTSDNPYEVKLIEGTSDNKPSSTLDRGKFYDLTLLATSLNIMDMKFEVMDWTTVNLLYDLTGPVYLNVEETNVSIESGSETRLSFTSNRDVTYSSPTWTNEEGEEIDFYDIRFEGGEAVITINAKIPASELKKINDNESLKAQYSYFHLIAGNILHKKITVYPLSLDPFLMVDPEEIIIDVREQIGSGHYKDRFAITVRTNCPSYTVTPDAWEVLLGEGEQENNSHLLYVTDENGNRIEFGTTRYPENGKDILYLWFDELNGGHTFWTSSSHNLGLTFTASDENVEPDYIRITTKPSSDNYIIHMKCNWSNRDPHIYVYQCLEIPGWFDKNNYAYANDPLGYTVGSTKNAALEYSFTGKIAFLGWDSYYNNKALYDYNFASNGKDNGFWMLGNGGKGSWEAISDDGSHYDLNYDFAADYRKGLSCADCKKTTRAGWTNDGNYNGGGYWTTWPGIQMKKEKDVDGGTWYVFTLSGAATPGKALIMFNGGHGKASGRYPDADQVGIPLFDYPNREGWIDLTQTSPSFTSEDPDAPAPTSGLQTFRFYYYYEYGGTEYYSIHLTAPDNKNVNKTGTGTDSNIHYYEFKADMSGFGTRKWKFYARQKKDQDNKWETTEMSATLSDFEWNAGSKTFIYKTNPIVHIR